MSAPSWKDLKAEIDAEVERVWQSEPLELRKLRLGIIENEAGSYGQYFTTWDFANGMIRDYSMYTLYPMLRLSLDDAFTLDHCRKMFRALDPQYTIYLGYSGYRTLDRFGRAFAAQLDLLENKQQFVELLTSLLKYANKLAQWSFHYFPHDLGAMFPQSRAREIGETLARSQ